MNKKIKIEVAVGIILVISIVIGGAFWLQNNNQKNNFIVDNNRDSKQVSTIKSFVDYQSEKTLNDEKLNQGDCNKIADFGSNDGGSGVFVYSTICRLGSQCNRGGDSISIVNYYMRDFEGNFNKKIFTTEISKKYKLFDFYASKEKDGFNVFSGGAKYFVNNSGSILNDVGDEVLDIDQAKNNYEQELYSPDKKYIARILASDRARSEAIVEVYDIQSKKTKKYDFRKKVASLNGIYIDSWTLDSRYFYVAGGMWEFSAPALLWRVDMESKKIISYDNLKGMVYPITVYPDREVALVRDDDHFGAGEGDIYTNIFALDLKNGDIEKVVKESGSVSPIVVSYKGKAYYGVYQNEDYENGDVKYIDILERNAHDFLKNSIITKPVFKSWSYTFENEQNGYFSFKQNDQLYIASFDYPEQKKLIGNISPSHCDNIQHGIEYINSVEAWTK